MPTKLIELQNGVLVEVEIVGEQVEEISGNVADKVEATLDKIRPILINTCKPVVAAWQELSKDMHIEEAEIELGLGFEGEGNIYVTKAKAGANITVKLTLKPK